ncbi:MAG: hypothetical protein HOC23_19155 [Halieaceae bacterium]|jgi:hypothetical protein|nr:hypothetical protein [Halieaceae bacterium]
MLSDQLRGKLLDYLDARLTGSELEQFEAQLNTHPELKEEYHVLLELQSAGVDWQPQDAPQWGRLAGLNAPRQRPATPWMTWLSLAASLSAVALISLQAQFTRTSDGFSISFNSGTSTVVSQQVEARMDILRQQQQNYTDQEIEALEKKNLAMNKQMLTAALSFNREERRQDMRELVSYWAKSRYDDRQAVERIMARQFDDQMAIQQLYTRMPQ